MPTQTTPEAAKKAVEAVEVVQELKKQAGTIGINQIGNTTPNWATWGFRIFFYVHAFALIFIGFDPNIPAAFVKGFVAYSGIAIIGIHGFSKMVGIDTKKIQQEANDSFADAQKPL